MVMETFFPFFFIVPFFDELQFEEGAIFYDYFCGEMLGWNKAFYNERIRTFCWYFLGGLRSHLATEAVSFTFIEEHGFTRCTDSLIIKVLLNPPLSVSSKFGLFNPLTSTKHFSFLFKPKVGSQHHHYFGSTSACIVIISQAC